MRHSSAPQPSSTVTTLRALVMLVCLIGIPVMALRGTAVPGMIRDYVIQKLGGSVAESDARADLDEAPPYVPTVSGPPEVSTGVAFDESAASSGSGSQNPYGMPPSGSAPSEGNPAARWSRGPQYSVPGPPLSNAPTRPDGGAGQAGRVPGAVLANYDSPSAKGSDIMPPIAPEFPGSSGAVPAREQHTGAPNAGIAGTHPQSPQPPAEIATIDQFLYIQKRLRDLGANYYLLESWGNQGECYRFLCRVAVANSADFTKHFEATDDQPLEAMTRVLADVEAWRKGTPPWEPTPVGPGEPAPLQAGLPNQGPPAYDPYRR